MQCAKPLLPFLLLLALFVLLAVSWRTTPCRAEPDDEAIDLRRRLAEQAARIAELDAMLHATRVELAEVIQNLRDEQERHVVDVSQLHQELAAALERLERQRLESVEVRHALRADLGKLVGAIGEPAVAGILALVGDSRALSQRDLVSLLGDLGPKARAALDTLRELAADKEPEEEGLAAEAAEAIRKIEGE